MRFILSFCCAAGTVLAPFTAGHAQPPRPDLLADPAPGLRGHVLLAQADPGPSGPGGTADGPGAAQPPAAPSGQDQKPAAPDTQSKTETKPDTNPTLSPTPNVPNNTTGNIGNTTSDPSRTTSNPSNTTSNPIGTTRDPAHTTSDPGRRTVNAGTINQNDIDSVTGVPGGTPGSSKPGQLGTGTGQTTNQPVDDYGQNTKPAQGSARPAGTGGNALGSQGRLGNLNNPQSGLSQSLDNAYGRTLTNPATLGPNARGGFFPTPPTASNALKPNSGYGTPTGARPSHMDARGIQRIN